MAMITLDKHFPDCCEIDTETWLSEVFHIDLLGPLPEALAATLSDNYMEECTADILAFIAQREGQEYQAQKSDYTGNHENDFSNDFAFQVFTPADKSDWIWANGAYVAVEFDKGPRLYKINDSIGDSGFTDWLLSWRVSYSNGENADDNGEFGAGYHENPGYHLLNEALKGSAVWSYKRDCFLGVLKSNGRFVQIRPAYYGGGSIVGSYDSKE